MNWLINNPAAGAGPLTALTVVYALLLYAALLAMVLGLIKFRQARADALRTSAAHGPQSGRTFRRVLDALTLRRLFETDTWAWLFRICVTYGLALSLVRHLRYLASPEWTGPLWTVVLLLQPVGLYTGLAMVAGVLGIAARAVLVPRAKASVNAVDTALLALVCALAASGYAMAAVPTDVVALKAFLVGLATFNWRPLPTDGLLLLHLWLGAAIVLVFVFGKLLPVQAIANETINHGSPRLKIGWAQIAAALLLVPAGFGATSVAQTGWTRPIPSPVKLARGHWSENPTIMIRNHPEFLRSQMKLVVYDGVRRADNTIERCVTCHAVREADGRAVSVEDSRHFCTSCHLREAVNADCFTCHKSKPAVDGQPTIKNIAAIKAHLAQWSAKR